MHSSIDQHTMTSSTHLSIPGRLHFALALALASPLIALHAHSEEADASKALANSVVKIFTTRVNPDASKPWTKQAPAEVTGSGVVIEGNRILTNAHVALYASELRIQANESGDKLAAAVEFIAPGIDLAVLKLDDEGFFKTHFPMPRATSMPAIKDAVLAYGFPAGGDSQSITKGIVSRIEFTNYRHHVAGLRIQVDAAINPGNSGGPVVAGDKMIGLIFSNIATAQNIGYIIPNEEIELFLKDIADGRYDGKPGMFDDFQTLENPALRAYLKLDKEVKGMVVTKPLHADPTYPLKKWDVVTHIGNTAVDSQGMVTIGEGLRVRMRYLAQKLTKNGRLPLTVVRDGKTVAIELPVASTMPVLIDELLGTYPAYFVYGPLVLTRAFSEMLPQYQSTTTANANLANLMVSWSLLGSPLVTQRGSLASKELEELVVVAAPFFPHKSATGYSSMAYRVIKSVNGTPVRSLSHLVVLLRDMKNEFVTFDVETRGGESVVFRHKDMLAATEEVLASNSIRAQGSEQLMKVWNGQAEK
jgi:S1-C subfamily serine protease